MKIYVAGKWEERERITHFMNELRKQGHIITCDWTDHKYDTREVMASFACDDLEGVRTCNAYIGVFENECRYRGALVEMGAALVLRKDVFIIGHAEDSCIFMLCPTVWHFRDMRDCLDYFSQKVVKHD